MYSDIFSFIRALFGGGEFIPLHEPRFIGNEKKYLNACIDSTFVSSVGEFVDRFEKEIARICGVKYAIACMNGTAALHTSLVLSGVNSNDEVITQPLSFIATSNAIAYTGASIIYLDVDLDSLGLSPVALEEFLESSCELRELDFKSCESREFGKSSRPASCESSKSYESSILNESSQQKIACFNKKTNKIIKAIVPMHTFGHPCKIKELANIAKKWHIALIEDCAESLGSLYQGTHTGNFGIFAALSFNGNKIITSGGGGAILTNSQNLAKLAKHITTTAKIPHAYEYVHDRIGYNYRLPNINAALLVAQMENLAKFLANKRELALIYADFFESKGIELIKEPQNCISNYWLQAIKLENKIERDRFLESSNAQGIMTRPIWRLNNELEMYKNMQCGNLSNAISLSERIVNIPSSVRLP